MTLKKTYLHNRHIQLNAKMAEFANYDMPTQYSSIKKEVLAVRKDVGIFDVSHMGEFFLKGPDACFFTDALMTNDFLNVDLHRAVYSPLCNDEGFILDDVIAYKLNHDRVLICVNASNIEKDWSWISSKAQFYNVKLLNSSSSYSLLAIQGPRAVQVMEKLSLLLDNGKNFPYYSIKNISLKGAELIIARTGYTGEDGFEIFGPHDQIILIWDQALTIGAIPCGLAARDVLRLEAGLPLYGNELTENWTPLDANLKWTVKFHKEFFFGKEALQNYQPKWKLIKLGLDKVIPRIGYPIKNAQKEIIGKVTSGTMSVIKKKGICFGLVNKNNFKKNEPLFITVRDKDYPVIYYQKTFL